MKNVADETDANINEDDGCKAFKSCRVGQVFDSDDRADKYPWQSTDDNRPGQRPYHSFFFYIPVNTARYGNNVEQMVGCADRRSGKTQNTDLKGQEHEST